ncbi:MAG: CoA transferase [Actinomycetota bacterium]|nr:CoA transferase [Actinomycetota bacterium]
MLNQYRILDLSDHRGAMAANILATLGAEIVLVEGPDGRGRNSFPQGPDGVSLDWWSMRRGAKSVVIENRAELMQLVAGADVLIESPDVGTGLNVEELRAVNPSLVHATITGYGSTGPKKNWVATDLTIAASAGSAAVTGDADRAPLRISTPQSFLHAGQQAAAGIAVALYERSKSGLGQHVDVSAQQSLMQAAFPANMTGPHGQEDTGRTSGGILVMNYHLQFVYPASDGHVSITLLFGDTIGIFTSRLMAWVYEEGFCSQELRDLDWVNFGLRLFTEPDIAPVQMEEAKLAIGSFTATRTKASLFEESQEREVLLAPVSTPGSLVELNHFQERKFWDVLDDPSWGTVVAPGNWVQPSSGRLPVRGLPPELGADTKQLMSETRLPFAPKASDTARRLPFDGLKVLDTTWVYAGPFTTRLLADFGATVIKVEGPNRFDLTRGGTRGLNDDPGIDASIAYGTLNAGKKSLTLDLNTEKGKEVFRDLANWADVLIESYTPGTLDNWGLGYDSLCETNPLLIMLSTSLMGQTGPLSTFAGFGNLAGAITGFYEMTGWTDRDPAGPFLAYTDYVVPGFKVALLVAALEKRKIDGKGQYLDFSQAEAAVHFLTSAVLESTVNGTHVSRLGNSDRFIFPHGMYRTQGTDSWVAIVCETNAQWVELSTIVGYPAMQNLGVNDRFERSEEIDALIEAWTSAKEAEDIELRFQSAGIPCQCVINSKAAFADPQLKHRNHWLEVEHPVHKKMTVEAPRFQLSHTAHKVTRSGPSLGEHNDFVLRSILGYSDDEIIDIAISGAIG